MSTTSCQRRRLSTIIKQAIGACDLRANAITLQGTVYQVPTSGALPDVVRFCKSLPASFALVDDTHAGEHSLSDAIPLIKTVGALAHDDKLSDVQVWGT